MRVSGSAAAALAKFAAVNEDLRGLALWQNRCLIAAPNTIEKLLENDPFVKEYGKKIGNKFEYGYKKWHEQEAKEKQEKTRDEDKDKDRRNDFYSFELPLMHLSVETISYLSIHIETKIALAILNDVKYFETLIKISHSKYFLKNRALRHGLLSIVTNCCLSYLSEKEKQLMKLTKVCAKSLPNNPEKENSTIHSSAGEYKDIFKIQQSLVNHNCIQLMYDIIKYSERENAAMHNFLNSRLFHENEIDDNEYKSINKLRKTARLSQNDWNKYRNTKKFQNKRKKDTFVKSEKIKYHAIELEEQLQLKIAQVLMILSVQNAGQLKASKI